MKNTINNHASIFAIALLTSGALYACDVDQTKEGKMPEVNVTEGEMPEYEVEGPDVKVGTETKEIEVPEVEMKTEKKEVEVPSVDVDMPDND